jgi:hypothetical protein
MNLVITSSGFKGKVLGVEYCKRSDYGDGYWCVLRIEGDVKAKGPIDFLPKTGMPLALDGYWESSILKFSDATQYIDIESTSLSDIIRDIPGIGPASVKKLRLIFDTTK